MEKNFIVEMLKTLLGEINKKIHIFSESTFVTF